LTSGANSPDGAQPDNQQHPQTTPHRSQHHDHQRKHHRFKIKPWITVGVGKTHIAQALAHQAIRAGAEARFAKTSRILAELAGGHADGTWTRRLRELARPAVLVLDDFAMRELTPNQADDLYELINERAGRSLILTSNRSPVGWYPLFPNPVVAESLLDRLINNSHQLLMAGASYRPRTRPGRVADQGTTTTR
jgi:DNA replication protein DnaC